MEKTIARENIWQKRWDMLKEVIAEQTEEERNMRFRHPWFSYMYNWIVVFAVIGLAISFVIWGADIRAERTAADLTATAMAEFHAEQQAAQKAVEDRLAAERASQEAVIASGAKSVAKAFYGIRNFIDKYGYDRSDLDTYSRCMFNRVDAGNGVNSLEVIIAQPEQFLGYADGNPVLDEYYKIAYELVSTWMSEETKPCDTSYRFAELTEKGIYLTDTFNAGPYDRRWHA